MIWYLYDKDTNHLGWPQPFESAERAKTFADKQGLDFLYPVESKTGTAKAVDKTN